MSKRLLILGGGYEQLHAVRIAKELGAYVIVFDGHEIAPCQIEANEFHQVNIKNTTELLQKCSEVKPEAIFVHAAELAIEAARIAEKFNLIGLSQDQAKRGTDKSVRSECFRQADINIPLFKALGEKASWKEWEKAAGAISFPLIVKPTKLAGAQGVMLVKNKDELQEYFQSRTQFTGQKFIIEQYVEGEQLSTESVLVSGELISCAVALRHYDTTKNLFPYQIEDGHSMPWDGTKHYISAIEKVTEKAAKALGMQDGVLKGDIIIKEDGTLIVLEMAVRTSGGRFCDTVVPLSSGVHILYPLIQRALGQSVSFDALKPQYNVGVSQRFVLVPAGTPLKKSKKIQKIVMRDYVSASWFRDDIMELEQAPTITSHRDRLGYVICTGKNRMVADARAREIVQEITDEITGAAVC